MCTPEDSWKLHQAVQKANPLIQCITNLVSMDLMANTLLCFGANPAMVHSMEEVQEFAAAASALVVNVGTLEPNWVAAMKMAAMRCVELQKHWVLDPVGAGATTYRTNAIKSLLECKPSVVRGNASEVMTAAGLASTIKGAESTASVDESVQAAKDLAKRIGCVVAVSGKVDYVRCCIFNECTTLKHRQVTDGMREARISNGTPMLTKITAAGCSLNAVIAAACASRPDDTFKATVHAMALYELAAELAEEKAARKGPASVRQGLLDELYLLQEQDVLKRIKIQSS